MRFDLSSRRSTLDCNATSGVDSRAWTRAGCRLGYCRGTPPFTLFHPWIGGGVWCTHAGWVRCLGRGESGGERRWCLRRRSGESTIAGLSSRGHSSDCSGWCLIKQRWLHWRNVAGRKGRSLQNHGTRDTEHDQEYIYIYGNAVCAAYMQ